VKFEASPLFVFLAGFANVGFGKGERESSLKFEWGMVYCCIQESNLRKDYVSTQSQLEIPPFAYVGEKTLNMLLGGKLLTDAEKRQIVKRLKVISEDNPASGSEVA
jgi:hypothetical protein